MPNDPIGIPASNGGRIPGSGVGTDEYVKVSDDDTTADHLDNKIAAGAGIALNILNDGDNEQLQIVALGAGGSDDEVAVLEFDYTSPATSLILAVNPTGIASELKVFIENEFDGTASISIGIAGNEDLLMQTDEIDPYAAACYKVNPGVEISGGVSINLYLSLTDTTQGDGRVVFSVAR